MEESNCSFFGHSLPIEFSLNLYNSCITYIIFHINAALIIENHPMAFSI